jgi:peptidyl-prolyl cis-trans isomerase C
MNSRNLRRLPLFILLMFVLFACTPNTQSADPVFLTINGHSITIGEFRKDFAGMLPSHRPLSAEERKDLERSYIVQIIDRRLALEEAERLGIALSPEAIDSALAEHRRDYPEGGFEEMLQGRGTSLAQWRRGLSEGLLIERVARLQAYGKVSVAEEEIAAYYQENREKFHRPAQVRARQIVVGSQKEGEDVLKALHSGESFAEVARRDSLSPDAEQGGDLGFFARGEMPPEFEAVVFALPIGELSKLERSEYGYHIFLVEERRAALRFSLEDARDEIRDALRSEKEEMAYRQWIQGLRARASIEVDWSLL